MRRILIVGTILMSILMFSPYNTANASNTPEFPGIDYVKDPSMFKLENDPKLSVSEAKAIKKAKKELETFYGTKVRGIFSVAKSRTGYQVNFYNIEKKITANKWQEVAEGFGEVFLSHDLKVLSSAIGP